MTSLRLPALPDRVWPALVALLVWALAAGSAAVWWLHLPRDQGPTVALASPGPSSVAAAVPGALERALGHTRGVAAAPDVHQRFVLMGVIAAESGQGSALIRVDGQPARAFLRGQIVAEGWRLAAVGRNGVRLEPVQASGADVALTLPPSR